MRHPDASLDGLGKCQRCKIIALRLYHQTNGFTLVNVQHTFLNQVRIDRRVKPTVVNNIVHMAIHVVVHPPGSDGAKSAVVTSGLRLRFGTVHFGIV